ncbi:MAG TPA: hypothetical protein VIL09_03205 [Microvirga sp.]|jgi:hypothetical protein
MLATLAKAPSPRAPIRLFRFADILEPRLAWTGLACLALMPPSLVALAFDERLLNGLSVWVKPLKFQASAGLYLLTLAWFVGALPEAVRRGRVMAAIVAVAVATSSFEIGYITLQAARGLASHYNTDDPFHAALYSLMGFAAVALTALSPAVAALLLRHRPQSWSTALWVAALLGLSLTFVLGAGAGAALSSGDGHWIGGVRTDEGGVPIVGWSRTGGDLRVAHFLGMHAMHALPALGFILGRSLRPRPAVALVALGTVAYCAATAFVFRQALAGLPLWPV